MIYKSRQCSKQLVGFTMPGGNQGLHCSPYCILADGGWHNNTLSPRRQPHSAPLSISSHSIEPALITSHELFISIRYWGPRGGRGRHEEEGGMGVCVQVPGRKILPSAPNTPRVALSRNAASIPITGEEEIKYIFIKCHSTDEMRAIH